MTAHHVSEILKRVEGEAALLGSKSAVARKCKVSTAYITHHIFKEPEKVADKTWAQIGAALGYSFAETWHMADTGATKRIKALLADVQENALCLAIADHAGIGKSKSLRAYRQADRSTSVFYVECKEWGLKDFLCKLAQELGLALVTTPKGAIKPKSTEIIELVCASLRRRRVSGVKPLLILDEFDKLKAPAQRALIPIYNELVDSKECAVVVCGSPALESRIRRGAINQVLGMAEIHSRLGETYVKLGGATKEDVAAICIANGIDDSSAIGQIWRNKRLEKHAQYSAQGHSEEVVHNLRVLQRIIEVERLILQRQHLNSAIPQGAQAA